MKKVKNKNFIKTFSLKKINHQIFTAGFINSKIAKSKSVNHFNSDFNRRNKLFNSSKTTVKIFFKLLQLQKLNNQGVLKYRPSQPINPIINPNYLLNLRNSFFTKKLNLVGSLCWPWFFDIYEELNFRNEFEEDNDDLEKSLQLRPRKFKKFFGKKVISTSKPVMGLLYNKRSIINRKRNTRKMVKLLMALSAKNLKDVSRNKIARILLGQHKRFFAWQTYIKRSTQQVKIQKASNPYLFLNNKEVKIRKFYKYSYDMYLVNSLKKFGPNVKKYSKSLFFSRKNKSNSVSSKKEFFTFQNIESFIKKSPNNYCKKKILSNSLLIKFHASLLEANDRVSKKSSIKNKSKFVKSKKRLSIYKKILRASYKNIYNVTVKPISTAPSSKFLKLSIKKNKKAGYKFFRKSVKEKNGKINFLRKIIKKLKARVRKFKPKKNKRNATNVRALILKMKWLRPKLLKFKNKNHLDQLFNIKRVNKGVFKGLKPKYTVNYNKLRDKAKKKNKTKRLRTELIATFIKDRALGAEGLVVDYLFFKKVGFGSYAYSVEKTTGYVEKNFNNTQGLVKNLHVSRSYVNYRYITLNSKKNKAFAFRNVGVFLWSQRKKFFDKNIKSRFIFKKKLYSFLFPNEVRKAIMNRRKSFKSYRFVYNKSNLRKKKGYYSLVFFKANYKNFFRLTALAQALPLRNKPLSQNWLNSVKTREEVLYEGEFHNKGHIENSRGREIFLKRIRFKPGYQRIWRQAREAALEHFNIRTVYQQQLTKYLSKFYRQAHFNSFMFLETTLGRTIVYSRLLPDYPSVNLFKEKNFIFLNRKSLPDLNTQVVPNDFIQLMVANWFYIYNRWVTNTTLLRTRKFKRLVYRKGMAHKYKVIKLRKQKSRYTPKWIYYSRFDHSDIKTYFEVDYFTMSMFVLYNPNTIDYSAPDDTIDLRISIYKMYNWKYIT